MRLSCLFVVISGDEVGRIDYLFFISMFTTVR